MLYCNKHSKSLHREGFVKIMSHATVITKQAKVGM